MKHRLAEVVASRVKDGERIGLGSGSTAELVVEALGKRISEEGIVVVGVPTSARIARLASQLGIHVLENVGEEPLDWAFDGADEVDPKHRLIKGRGAAMLSEKIIASYSSRFVVAVTEEKVVKELGKKFPVPVEVIPSAVELVAEQLHVLGATEIALREAVKKYGPVVTEHGNFILDARFDSISSTLEKDIKGLVGVVESGLFFDFTDEVLIARADGIYSQVLVDGKVSESKIA